MQESACPDATDALRAYFDAAPEAVLLCRGAEATAASAAARKLLTPPGALPAPLAALFAGPDAERLGARLAGGAPPAEGVVRLESALPDGPGPWEARVRLLDAAALVFSLTLEPAPPGVAAFVEGLPEAALAVGEDGRICACNAEARRLLGAADASALLGRPYSRWLPTLPPPGDWAAAEVRPTDRQRPPLVTDVRVGRIDGGLRLVTLRGGGSRGPLGALGQTEALFRNVFQSAGSWLCIFDPEGAIVEGNAAMAHALGAPPAALHGMRLEQLVHPDHAAATRQAFARLVQGKVAAQELEGCYVTGRGGLLWGSLHLSAIRDGAGRTACVVGQIVDLTVQKEAIDALRESEQRFRLLAENARDVVYRYRLTPTPGFDYVSPSAAEVSGYTPEELYADPGLPYKLVHPDDLAAFAAVMAPAPGRSLMLETRWLRKDGRQIWVEERFSQILDDAGNVVAFEGIARDVSERKADEEKVRRFGARYQAFSQLLGAYGFAYVLHPDGRREYEWVTEGCCDVFGRPPEEMLRLDWVSTVYPEDLDAFSAYAGAIGRGEKAVAQFRIVRAEGAVRWVHAVSVPHPLAEGGLYYVTGAGQDITPQKQTERDLVEAKEEAEHANRAKDVFLANMSHEVRTPLTAIIGFADLLAGEVEGEAAQFAHLIRGAGERLMETLNSVLDLAQLRGRKLTLKPERVLLAEEAEACLALLRPRAEARGLRLRFEAAPEAPPVIVTDRAALHRVLTNLVTNAVKFTEDGEVAVALRADGGGGGVALEVADTGIGISEAFLPKVFEEFQQESSGMARSFEGNGLGLAITQRLVGLMGGAIRVRSTLGVGTVFTVQLPASL